LSDQTLGWLEQALAAAPAVALPKSPANRAALA
jgi:hypothetical protein